MADDRRYMTWEERAADDARYRPGGEFGAKAERKNRSKMCSCGKTVFVDANGSRTPSDACPQCGDEPATS